jgi:hypothetical protein
MQTYLPVANFEASAKMLDLDRLGLQRVEALQILNLLTTGARLGHPAVEMWKGYEPALVAYARAISDEWVRRGNRDTVKNKINEIANEATITAMDIKYAEMPPWFGTKRFHASHRANLVRMMPNYYGRIWPGHRTDLKYYWPTRV